MTQVELPKILIVDDRPENLFAMRQVLKPLDAEIITADSGKEALSQLLRHRFAVVLLDVQMPEMDGFEVASIMRDASEMHNTPIIFITAISKDQKYVFKGYEIGAIDYLFKPVEPDILIPKIRVFLELSLQRDTIESQNREYEQTLAKLRETTHQKELLLDSAAEGILGVNNDGKITFANPTALRQLDAKEEEFIGKHVNTILFPSDFADPPEWENSTIMNSFEVSIPYHISDTTLWRCDGTSFPAEYTSNSTQSDDSSGGVILFQDITLRKQAELQLVHMAKYDGLTNLANRSLFLDELNHALTESGRRKRHCAVLFLDLDHFKYVNDSLGHDIGDKLLRKVAERLLKCVRTDDVVSRHGGDEFAILLNDMASLDDASKVAQKILDELTDEYNIDEHIISSNPSIGIATYPACGQTPSVLLKAADAAMYQAKQQGRNNFQFFNDDLQEKVIRRRKIEEGLHRAIDNNEFNVIYQPFVDISNNTIIGTEALLRWENKDLNHPGPAHFIPVAEETGLIIPIGKWVFEQACKQLRCWQDAGIGKNNFKIAVNVSAHQLVKKDFAENIVECIHNRGINPDDLEIELTEGTVMKNPELAISVLNKLHDFGVGISIDDFGTGYSSLSYLRHLPIDVLKIDRSFTKDIGKDESDESIIKTIIAMSHNLDMKVVAEGVETHEQLNFLKNNGCDVVQGYLFSKPVTSEVFEQLIQVGFTNLAEAR